MYEVLHNLNAPCIINVIKKIFSKEMNNMANISSTVSNSLIAGTDESDSIYSSGDSVDNHGRQRR